MIQALHRGSRRFFINQISPFSIDPLVTSWAGRVVLNGGATPSVSTQLAMSSFARSLADSNLYYKMVAINCFAPDSLVACMTPLMATSGKILWLNQNFVGGDLTVSGLAGNGSNKYVDTGLDPASCFRSNNTGMTCYQSAGTTALYTMCGVGSGSNPSMILYSNNTTPLFDCWDNSASRIVASGGGYTGFFSGNRTGTNAAALHWGTSLAFTQIGSTTNATTGNHSYSPPAICIFSLYGLYFFNPGTISFVAIHEGLTGTEVNALFQAVQTLRVNLGGGYV